MDSYLKSKKGGWKMKKRIAYYLVIVLVSTMILGVSAVARESRGNILTIEIESFVENVRCPETLVPRSLAGSTVIIYIDGVQHSTHVTGQDGKSEVQISQPGLITWRAVTPLGYDHFIGWWGSWKHKMTGYGTLLTWDGIREVPRNSRTILVVATYVGVPSVPLYRMFHPEINQHLWTTCANEYEVLATRGWNQEGIAWHTPTTGRPVHRLFHEGIVRHHYTADKNEIRVLQERGWNDEGPLFYCASPDVKTHEGIRMTRLFHEDTLKHLHTADANEVRILTTEHGWNNEGESFVGLPVR